jgi:hypothetical protein
MALSMSTRESARVLGLGVLALLASSGCASVRLAPAWEDAAAKSFATAPASTTAFIYWPEDSLGRDRRAVVVDGRWWSEMSVGTFAAMSLSPGAHVLHVADTDPSLDVRFTTAEPGSLFFEASLDGARAVDEKAGRPEVVRSRLVEATDALDYRTLVWLPLAWAFLLRR